VANDSEPTSSAHDTGNNALTLGFSFAAGLGLILIISGLAYGVTGGSNVNDDAVVLMLAAGAAFLILGLGAWLSIMQPWTRFDDINVPMNTGHHNEPHASTEHSDDDTAISGAH
jgi:ABC-type nickel/cobalt efflux system permease component RcnA